MVVMHSWFISQLLDLRIQLACHRLANDFGSRCVYIETIGQRILLPEIFMRWQGSIFERPPHVGYHYDALTTLAQRSNAYRHLAPQACGRHAHQISLTVSDGASSIRAYR